MLDWIAERKVARSRERPKTARYERQKIRSHAGQLSELFVMRFT
jgi:hypothetical protein